MPEQNRFSSAQPPASDPAEPPLTLTIHGLTASYRKVQPLVIGSRVRMVIDFDPATMQAQMRPEPADSLSPGQAISLLLSLATQLTALVHHNEEQLRAAGLERVSPNGH